MAVTKGGIVGLLEAWARPAAGAVVGAMLFFVASQVMSRAGGTCVILCNPLVAVPYGALLGVLASGGPMKAGRAAEADDTPTST
jgi:hypothetical protein